MSEVSMRAIVTVVNVIGAASMPYNEFVMYRARKFPQEKHVVIVWDKIDPAGLPPRAENIAIVACQGSFWKLASLTRRVLKDLRLNYRHAVVHLHQPRSGILFQLLRPVFGWDFPILFTIHNSYNKYSMVRKILTGLNFLLADGVTFVSQSSYHAFPAYLHGLRARGVRTVRNGVDVERVDSTLGQPAAARGRARNSDAGVAPVLNLINVGRFVEQKNHRFLIELLSQLPGNVTLTLVGEGPLRHQAALWVSKAGLSSRVRFTGLIPREAVYDEMRHADIFVSGSLWEGLPIAALEAMTVALPVMLSDIESHREIAEVAPGAEVLPLRLPDWRERLLSWSSLPREDLAGIGEQNRDAVVAELSLARMHDRYSEVYQGIAG
jgi:glycosyltransferase involved in cell wall biosynthesis